MDAKRVKFEIDSNPEYNEEELNGGHDNDLDLDTVKASRSKPKGLKEFDSEGSEEEEEEDGGIGDSGDSDFGEEELEEPSELDDRQIPIEPFNLKADREEGSFDSDGFYVKKHDEEADQDRWMAHFTHSDMQKARKAHAEIERKRLQKEKEAPVRSEKELWEELAREMDGHGFDNSSLLGVITSLKSAEASGPAAKPRAPLNKNRLKKLQKEQGMQLSQESTKMAPEQQAKLEKLTELADALMDLGYFGIYEESRRDILHKLGK